MAPNRDRAFEIIKAWSDGRIGATEASLVLGREERDYNVLIDKLREFGLPYPDLFAGSREGWRPWLLIIGPRIACCRCGATLMQSNVEPWRRT